jgi:citrate lyase subunit beta/citryl-CoA lyase
MIPKVETAADVQRVVKALADLGSAAATALPLHVLIESPLAVHNAFEIAGQPRVQSLSFGLMDFVSSHNGAIPAEAMGSSGQFSHPLVLRAKLAIASACHAHGKVPSHCVVTEFSDAAAMQTAALHPSQISPILAALAPQADELAFAAELIVAADRAQWAPISFQGKLHDRASYRYFWQLLERGHQTGAILPGSVQGYFLRHASAG